MIPQRTLSSEIFGSELKSRVAACRHRLRVNRAAQRVKVNSDARDLLAETTPAVSRFQGYAPGNSVTASLGATDYRSPRVDAQHGENETMLVGDQKVGIT
jgi:hypothetical protein